MKRAKLDDGRFVEASPDAPDRAVCPHCGATVLLRRRKTMLDGETWYWRHAKDAPSTCPARSRVPGKSVMMEVDSD